MRNQGINKFVLLFVVASICGSAIGADLSYKTRGDMTDSEIKAIMSLRDKEDAYANAISAAGGKLGGAIIAGTFGAVLEAGALTAGGIKSAQDRKAERANLAELEKLDDVALTKKFEEKFTADFDADKKKNLTEYKIKEKAEDGKEVERELTAADALKTFMEGKSDDVKKQAMLDYLMDNEQSSRQKTLNWVRAGAAAGGAITSFVSAGIIGEAQKDIENIDTKRKELNAAAAEFNRIALQARNEGRKNNPLTDIANNCADNKTYSGMLKNLKTAKVTSLIGGVAGVGAAATSGIQNVNSVGEKKGLNVASSVSSGLALASQGVGIGFAAAAKKNLKEHEKGFDKCEDWLWWDNNGHGFEGGADNGDACELGKYMGDNGCISCNGVNENAILGFKKGDVCKLIGCKPGYILIENSIIYTKQGSPFNSRIGTEFLEANGFTIAGYGDSCELDSASSGDVSSASDINRACQSKTNKNDCVSAQLRRNNIVGKGFGHGITAEFSLGSSNMRNICLMTGCGREAATKEALDAFEAVGGQLQEQVPWGATGLNCTLFPWSYTGYDSNDYSCAAFRTENGINVYNDEYTNDESRRYSACHWNVSTCESSALVCFGKICIPTNP